MSQQKTFIASLLFFIHVYLAVESILILLSLSHRLLEKNDKRSDNDGT